MPSPSCPLPSPPFHQISFPLLAEPLRKLQAVRFWIVTSFVFQTTIPLRPMADPPCLAPKSWEFFASLHGLAAFALVPSTIVRLRLIPRMWRSGVCTRTADGGMSLPALGGLLRSLRSW